MANSVNPEQAAFVAAEGYVRFFVYFPEMADDSLSVDSDMSRFSDLIDPEASNDSGNTASSGAISLDTRVKLESYLQAESRKVNDVNLTEITINNSVVSESDKVVDGRTTVSNDVLESHLNEHVSSVDKELDRTTDHSAIDQADVANNKALDNYSAIEKELVVGSEDLDSSFESLKLPVNVPSVNLGVDDIVGKILKEGSDNSNGRFLDIPS